MTNKTNKFNRALVAKKKGVLTLIATAVVVAIALTGCVEPEGTTYYSTDAIDSVFVVRGHSAYAQQFLTAMNDAMSKYDEAVNPNEKQIVADFLSIKNQFDNRYLFGNLRLFRTLGEETTILETCSLQTQPKFYIYDYSKVQGTDLEVFKQAVISKVADLDEAEGVGSLTEDAVKEAMQTIYNQYNKDTLLTGNFEIYYYDGKENKSVVTYTFAQ